MTADDVHVRDLIPGLDLGPGADNSAAVDGPRFAQSGLKSGSNPNEVYRIDPDLKMSRGALAIVAITIRGSNATTEVQFRTSPGGVFERVQIQGGYTNREARVLLDTPVFYGLGMEGTIAQSVERDSDETIVYEGFVAEPAGTSLSRSPDNTISPDSV
jgi:hypothetical protein